MATKSDLIEAQNFSRRRLLTAFVSGAPGGKELEPTAPLRAVIAAIAVTIAVVLVGVFYGLIRPGLPADWNNGKLIVVSDTGARFVSVEGELHPVINTASARLLLPSNGFAVISTDRQTIADVTIGSTLGIVGAPDALPARGDLSNSGWSACVAGDDGTDLRIGGETVAASEDAVVVDVAGKLYVVDGGRSFAVPQDGADAVLRAAGITTLAPVTASTSWLNLFVPGTPLTPIVLSDVGAAVAGSDLRVGEVVHITGDAEAERYLVQSDGSLGALGPLAWQLYQLGGGRAAAGVTEVTSAETADLLTSAAPVGGADWPTAGFTPADSDQTPCAVLQPGDDEARSAIGFVDDTVASGGVHIAVGGGALVRAGGRGDQNAAILTLVDSTGVAYPLPGATDETVARLGYTADDVGAVPAGWVSLLPTGPDLTEAAAGESPVGER